MSRLIFTAATGKPEFAEMAIGLARSLDFVGDKTDRAIVTDITGVDWRKYFRYVLPVQDASEWIYLSKLDLLARTDATQVLWIDADCLAFQHVAPIFDHCEGKWFAIPGYIAYQGDYYGRVEEHCRRHGLGEFPKVTAGMMYYERSDATLDFIRQVQDYARVYDSLGFMKRCPQYIPDEPCIALAMAKSKFGSLICETTNFIHSAAGLVGKLRLDILKNQCEFACHQESTRFFRPRIFHAWRYKDYTIYWRQLDRLRKLRAYADSHESMHMSRTARFARSVQRRLIKIRKDH